MSNCKKQILYPNEAKGPQSNESKLLTNAESDELQKLEEMDEKGEMLAPEVRERLHQLREKKRNS